MGLDWQSWVMLAAGFLLLGGGFSISVFLAWRRHKREKGWAKGTGLTEDIDVSENSGAPEEKI